MPPAPHSDSPHPDSPAPPVPFGRTARRLEWTHLPPHVRRLVEQRCGSAVVRAESQGGGYTPGFASVLTCEDGTRHFVKAASAKAQAPFAASYRTEARQLAALPEAVPAPRLQWLHDEDWVVLGIEHVAARAPQRPWRAEDLDRTLDTLQECARLLDPAPGSMALDTFADENAALPGLWAAVRPPSYAERRDEAAALAAGHTAYTAGECLVHADVRDDNLLLTGDRALLCDWNWPVRGAAWIDSVMALIGPRGDGLDVEAVIGRRDLLRSAPAEGVDALLALLTGFFLHGATQPVPPTSPYLRDFQRWQGEVCWGWLAHRRGWS